jgi:hypothetical protein
VLFRSQDGTKLSSLESLFTDAQGSVMTELALNGTPGELTPAYVVYIPNGAASSPSTGTNPPIAQTEQVPITENFTKEGSLEVKDDTGKVVGTINMPKVKIPDGVNNDTLSEKLNKFIEQYQKDNGPGIPKEGDGEAFTNFNNALKEFLANANTWKAE